MSHGVKVVHSGGVCRRFVVDDFQELKRGIRDLAGVDPCSVTLCYVDSDGDVVEMETATEFVAAVAQAGTRPLTIRLSARPLRPTPVPAAPLCAGADAGAASAALHLSVAAGAADTVHVLRAPRSTPYVPGSGGAATTATATIDAFVPRRCTTGHRDPCAPAVVAPSLRVEVLAECLATADKVSSPHGDLVLQVLLRAGSEAGLLRASCAVREGGGGGGGDAARVSSLRLAVSVEEAASSGPSAAGGEDGGSTTTRVTCDDEDEDEDSNSSSSVSGSSSSASSASRPARQRLTRRVLRRHRRAAARPAAAAVADAAADGNDDNERNKEKKTKKKKGARERRVADGGTRTSTSGGDDGSGTLTSSSSSSSLTTSVDESSTDASTYSTSSPSGTTSGSQTSLTTAASSATQQRRDRRRGGGSRRNRHREPEAAAAAAAAGSLPLAVPLASVELVMGQVVEGPYNMRGIALQGGSPRLGVPVSV